MPRSRSSQNCNLLCVILLEETSVVRGHVEADPKSPLLLLHHLELLPKDAGVIPPLQVGAVQEDHPVQIGEGLVEKVVGGDWWFHLWVERRYIKETC